MEISATGPRGRAEQVRSSVTSGQALAGGGFHRHVLTVILLIRNQISDVLCAQPRTWEGSMVIFCFLECLAFFELDTKYDFNVVGSEFCYIPA